MEIKAQPSTDSVVCPTRNDPVVRLMIVAAMLIGFGLWCLTDLREKPQVWDMEHINEVANYLLNNWGPVVFIPVGLVFAVAGLLLKRRKLVADSEGLGYAGKGKVTWPAVTGVDAKLLKTKDILLVEHGGGSLKLDGWKLQNFKQLVAYIEQNVSAEKIRR